MDPATPERASMVWFAPKATDEVASMIKSPGRAFATASERKAPLLRKVGPL